MKYIQLQSGFIAKDETKFKLPVIEKNFYKDSVIGKDYLLDTNRYFFHEQITNLFDKYNANRDLHKDLNFITEVIKAVKDAIDETSFFKWLLLQVKYAKLSGLHRSFIYDTLSYLKQIAFFEERPRRELEIAQWIKLIEFSPETTAVTVNIDNFFKNEVHNNIDYLPADLKSIISLWMSTEKGFEDLLISMYIIFGERRYINDVSDKVY